MREGRATALRAERPRLDRNVWTLSGVSFLTDAHSEAILALLPTFMADVLGLPKTMIGLVEGIAEAVASLLQVASGWLSDRAGRRKGFALAGYGLSTAVKSLLAFATSFSGVLAVRVADRLGKGLRSAPRDALLAESVAPEARGRAFGIHRTADTAGAVVGSGAAFLLVSLLHDSYQQVFLFAAIPGVLAVLLLAIGVREKGARGARGAGPRSVAPPMRWTPALIVFLVAHAVFSIGNFSYAFFLLRVQDLGVAGTLVPLVYLGFNVIYAALAAPAGRLSDAQGHRRLLLASYLVFALSCTLMALGTGPTWALAAMAIYAVHSAAMQVSSRAMTARLSESRKGTGLGYYHGLSGLAAFAASAIAGRLWDGAGQPHPAAPFWFGLCCALAAAAVLAIGQRAVSGEERQR